MSYSNSAVFIAWSILITLLLEERYRIILTFWFSMILNNRIYFWMFKTIFVTGLWSVNRIYNEDILLILLESKSKNTQWKTNVKFGALWITLFESVLLLMFDFSTCRLKLKRMSAIIRMINCKMSNRNDNQKVHIFPHSCQYEIFC